MSCKAELHIYNRYGWDSPAVMVCQLSVDHTGKHREEFRRCEPPADYPVIAAANVVVEWEGDDRKSENLEEVSSVPHQEASL